MQLLMKCTIKSSTYTKDLGIMGFKATLRLCQVAASSWRAGAGLASSGNRCVMAMANHAQHPHAALESTCVRLTVVTTYVQI